MARIPQVMLVFSGQSVTSAGTVDSVAFPLGRDAYASLHYVLATATTGTYVSCTAQLLVRADSRETFVLPVDTAGAVVGTLAQINSNNRFIRTAIPLAPEGRMRLISVTNNTVTFDAVYLVLDEQN